MLRTPYDDYPVQGLSRRRGSESGDVLAPLPRGRSGPLGAGLDYGDAPSLKEAGVPR
jgi:hypothetical protein